MVSGPFIVTARDALRTYVHDPWTHICMPLGVHYVRARLYWKKKVQQWVMDA
jgi:hypothetical protein